VAFRKKAKLLHLYDPSTIANTMDVTDFDGAIRLFYLDQNFIAPKKQVSIFYNPNNRPLSYGEPIKCSASYVSCGDNSDEEKSHTVKIPAMSIVYTED
jgi:hypothetical protein